MKIGLFGGIFNPIHNGHLSIAHYLLNEFDLDLIQFIPAYKTNYKKNANNTEHRINMIKLAINNSKMELNEIEIKTNELSFT